MFRNLAPSAVGISIGDFDELLALAKRHGFQGVDLPLSDPEFTAEPESFARKIEAAGMKWGGFGLPSEFRTDEGQFNNGLDVLKVVAPLAKRAGCDRCYTWIMPAHNELDFKANFEQHARRLGRVAEVLHANGIRFGIEFVGPKTLRRKFKHEFVCNIDGICRLADAAGHDTGVLLDSFHWYTSGAKPEDITRKLAGRIVYVHVNDARAGRGPDEQIDNERALPGDTGVIDMPAFLGALRQTGYDGPVAAEPFLHELTQLSADEAAGRVAASMKKIGL
jgi:sugar phosphate isomerase/epimerase